MEPYADEQARLAQALRELERAVAALVAGLAHEGLWIVTAEGGAGTQRRRVADALASLDYGVEDAPNATRDCLAVVGAPKSVVELARAVNVAKERFRTVAAPLQSRRVRVPLRETGADARTRAIPLTRLLLRRMQRSDLNLLAAYRRIPILDTAPASIAYVRAVTRAVYRKSREEILEMLEGSEHPAASADRARVRACRDRWFALVREHYPSVRANVTFASLDRRHRGRVQIRAELPVLFALGGRRALPAVRFPVVDHGDEGPVAPRRVRVGVLEAEPFLEAVGVYRYRGSG